MTYKHIKESVKDTISYIDKKRKGLELPLITTKNKLNRALDGFSWGRIYTLAGLSGAGKSITVEEIKRDLINYNKEEFYVLSFEFEMLAQDQIARNLSGRLNKSVKDLYSANREFLDDSTFDAVIKESKNLENYPIYYVDEIGDVNDIKFTIRSFISDFDLENTKKGLIITIDHILLTKGQSGQEEKQIIDSLMHSCVAMKKEWSSKGVKIMFILLSQLNREIEKMERVLNPNFHYPNKNDLFAASSVYYCSDVVIILHRPSSIEGLGPYYGPPRKEFPEGLPLFNEKNNSMLYWHIIKSRFGENQILMMVEDFKNSRVLEYSLSKKK